MRRGSDDGEKGLGRFLCELMGLWSCAAAIHSASFGHHLHVSDFHGAIHLAAVPGSCGVLAAVAIAVRSSGRGAASRCDVGHSSGYPHRVADVRFQILGGHELDSLRRLGLRAGLFIGLCASLRGLRPGLARLRCGRLRRRGLARGLGGGRLSRGLVVGHAVRHQDVLAVSF